MAVDKPTERAQEAIAGAARLARERSHQELQPEHLLAALLEDPEGTVAATLQKPRRRNASPPTSTPRCPHCRASRAARCT